MAVSGSGLTKLWGGEPRFASLCYSSTNRRTVARTSASVAGETQPFLFARGAL